VIGGIGILVPPVSVFAAILLLAVDAGALVAQVAVLHMDWIHTIVIGAILGTVIYLQRHLLSRA
jgi:putative oxidoreductase